MKKELRQIWRAIFGTYRICLSSFHKSPADRVFYCTGKCPKGRWYNLPEPHNIDGGTDCFCEECVRNSNWSRKEKEARLKNCFRR